MKLAFNLVPCEDESFSSWLIRISRKHYLSSKDFCSHFGLEDIWTESMDIDVDLYELKNLLGYDVSNIYTVKSVIHDFTWEKGRSPWLISPNRKGKSLQNSYTQICPRCLSKKSYIQLKWKFNLFFGCSICKSKLISQCPKCNRSISPLKSDIHTKITEDFNPLWNCSNCRFDLRNVRPKKLTKDEMEEIQKLEKAYMEVPANNRYLRYKQFGTIEGLQ